MILLLNVYLKANTNNNEELKNIFINYKNNIDKNNLIKLEDIINDSFQSDDNIYNDDNSLNVLKLLKIILKYWIIMT